MRKLDTTKTLQELAKALKKPCMYISIQYPSDDIADFEDALKAAPYLSVEEDGQILMDDCGYIVFDSDEEMEKTFCQTVGDDGPTETNKYDGATRVYAITCSADGELQNENT